MKAILVLFSMVVWTSAVFAQPDPDDWAKGVYYNSYNTSKMAMADLSGDGQLDLISAEQIDFGSFRIAYRPNNGSGFFPNFTVLRSYAVLSPNYVFKDMDTINVDGSGVMELAVSYSKEVSSVVTYHVDILQMSGSTLILLQTINVPAGGAQLVKSGYFDGVGSETLRLADLAVGSGSSVYIYRNNGQASPRFGFGPNADPHFTIQGSGMTTVRALSVGDFYNSGYSNDQNAGFNEIVLEDAASEWSGTYSFRRWNNNTPAAGSNWFVQQSGDPLQNPHEGFNNYNYVPLNAIDFNADGVQDFLTDPGIRTSASGIVWPPAPYYEVSPILLHGTGRVKASVHADINNDGKPDVVGCFWDVLGDAPPMDFPFVCYNDAANGFPNDIVDIDFSDYNLFPDMGLDRAALSMNLLAGDITGLGAISIVRVAAEDAYPWKDNKVVVYRRLDNPAPAPPIMNSIIPYQSHPKVKWFKNPEADVTQYEVYRGLGTETVLPSSYSLIGTTSENEFVDQGITWTDSPTMKKMYYKVRAKDAINQYSAYSNPMKINYVADIQKAGKGAPSSFRLSQNSPNPFNPTTRISYEIPEAGHVTLKIFNAVGQHVATLVNDYQEAGAKEITWNGKDDSGHEVASGLYLYRLQAGDQIKTMKMNLLK